jgi:hypothetical protein
MVARRARLEAGLGDAAQRGFHRKNHADFFNRQTSPIIQGLHSSRSHVRSRYQLESVWEQRRCHMLRFARPELCRRNCKAAEHHI